MREIKMTAQYIKKKFLLGNWESAGFNAENTVVGRMPVRI